MIEKQMETKKLYIDAAYWHLIHRGYPEKKAEMIIKKMLITGRMN